jgi:hypothetical protein
MRLLRWLACVLALGATLSAPGAAQPDDLSRQVTDEFAYLKSLWPQVAEPTIVAGDAIEFRAGRIELGQQALQRLVDDGRPFGSDTVVQFILAHEAWHSAQAARNDPAELDRLRGNRVLECEADFMGAAAVAARSAKSGVPADLSQEARSKLEDFIENKAPAADAAGNYLSPEWRSKVITLGWHATLKPELFAFVPDGPNHLEAAARQVCEMAANVSDGSIGRVVVSSSSKSVRLKDNPTPPAIVVTVNNNSTKKIEISYLLVETWWHVDGPMSPEIAQLVYDRKIVDPKSKADYNYSVTFRPPESLGGVLSAWSTHVPLLGGLVTTKYVEEMARPSDSCYGKLLAVAEPGDRAMFSALATIALAAPDDFKAVRSQSFQDSGPGMKTYDFTAGLARDGLDNIEITSSGSWASLTALNSDSEPRVLEEYARIKRVILAACPATAQERTSKEGTVGVWIDEFAPGVTVALGTNIWRIGHTGTRPPSPGGLVDFMIFKGDVSN